MRREIVHAEGCARWGGKLSTRGNVLGEEGNCPRGGMSGRYKVEMSSGKMLYTRTIKFAKWQHPAMGVWRCLLYTTCLCTFSPTFLHTRRKKNWNATLTSWNNDTRDRIPHGIIDKAIDWPAACMFNTKGRHFKHLLHNRLFSGGAVAVWVASRPEACRLSQLQGCGFESAPLTSMA